MGDFAEMEVTASIDSWRGGGRLPFWPSDAQAGKPLHPIHTHKLITCRRCGHSFLFWHKHEGEWRLHHYALLPGEEKPRFVLHRCGFTSDGKPKASVGRNPEGEDREDGLRAEHEHAVPPTAGDAQTPPSESPL